MDVFGGLGAIPGEYKIRISADAVPQVIPPRKIPIAKQEAVKKELDRMQSMQVITPVTDPTDWVNSMAVVDKPSQKGRICVDPLHLYEVIKRSHYPLPTFDDISSRLHGAKVFSVSDAKTGFWRVLLDEESSFMTTFNTPYGRYRWLRMPFRIASAQEEWQRRMHEIKGLRGVEVIADDFLVIGFGETQKDAIKDHDANLTKFLQRAREKELKLDREKTKLRLTEVTFVGHKLTNKGVAPDQRKVEAITKIPAPTDRQGLRRILEMVNYLAKFLPRLSDVSAPLRQFDNKGTEWKWTRDHGKAWTEIQTLVATAATLAYFDPGKEISIQCVASQNGLGVAMMQVGRSLDTRPSRSGRRRVW